MGFDYLSTQHLLLCARFLIGQAGLFTHLAQDFRGRVAGFLGALGKDAAQLVLVRQQLFAAQGEGGKKVAHCFEQFLFDLAVAESAGQVTLAQSLLCCLSRNSR